MPSSRIFVSYVCIGDEAGARIGKQLVDDIRTTGTEAVSDHETLSDTRFMPFLMRELPQCSYLVVVQTPMALQSWRVQSTLALASTLVTQRRLRALRVIAVSTDSVGEQPLWAALTAFDASVDYPRAREKVFLALNLAQVDADDSFIAPRPIAASIPRRPLPTNGYPPQQPSAPVAGPIVGNWPPAQPSGPIARPAGSEWPAQPPGPVARPVGTNWPAQPSGPMSQPIGPGWPPQQPSPPRPWPPAPVSYPGQAASQQANPAGSTFKNFLAGVPAFFSRLGGTTSQTSIAAQPSGYLNPAGDHPPSLDTRRRLVLRWVVLIGVPLVLIGVVTLIVILVRSHLPR